jgi:hypothetical protein
MRDFQEVVRDCSLADMSYHGPVFTWSNKREEGIINKKLDRVLVNEEWNRKFPAAYGTFEAGGCSDHLRCRVTLASATPIPKGPFKFNNVLTTMPEFLQTVQDFWAGTPVLYHSTSAMFRFSKKLKSLKPILKSLGRNKLHNLSVRVDQAYTSLCEKQKLALETASSEAIAEENQAYTQWNSLAVLEEGYLQQKSKLHWLDVGDLNNKYFHNSVKARIAMNSIREILCSDGIVRTSQEDIKEEAVQFFKRFLQAKPEDFEGSSVSEIQSLLSYRSSILDHERLLRDVTEEEIRKVLFSMPQHKSPGPDGYTVEFFIHAWPVLGKDFVIAIQSFFLKGFLPKGVNTTILALIPKKQEVSGMKDYRPISCCNVLYKVVSKLMANRLKEILPASIAPNQSAFIKDRLMMENLLLASELVKDYHKDSISSRSALKIDISKAFDSVQWPFLINILKAMCLPDIFIHWIELCISTASFSVQVNGELSGFFRSERGLRQGCSLSPYLFVICMNVLSCMLDKAAEGKRIGYHPRCRNMSLTHLCFADDIMVFSDGTTKSIKGTLEVFDRFAAMSGLKISLEKSTAFMAGISPRAKEAILQQFPFALGTLPVKYLGLPLLTKRMSQMDYLPLVEKIRTRITSWTTRFLSFAGRLQLIKSVLSSIINFWFSVFRLPKACLVEIEKLFSAFLWSGPELNAKRAKVAWSEVCKPKKEGGLGLKTLKETNEVSLLKLIWRILSARDSLWVQWLSKNLIRKESFWSVKGNSCMGSWIWKKILQQRDKASQLHRMEVRSGTSTSFWYDHWCPLGRLHQLLGPRGIIDLGIASHATVAEVMNTHRRKRHRVDLLNQIENYIALAIQDRGTESDRSLWKQKEDSFKCSFSSSTTWQRIRTINPSCDWYRGVWFSSATPKFSFITWLVFQNRLATGDKLRKWNSEAWHSCVFCDEELETRDHLFFSCPFSSQIWCSLTKGLLHGRRISSWSLITPHLLDTSRPYLHLFTLRYTFQATIHSLWRERNSRRHGGLAIPVTQLAKIIDKNIRNRFSTAIKSGNTRLQGGLQFWFQIHS